MDLERQLAIAEFLGDLQGALDVATVIELSCACPAEIGAAVTGSLALAARLANAARPGLRSAIAANKALVNFEKAFAKIEKVGDPQWTRGQFGAQHAAL